MHQNALHLAAKRIVFRQGERLVDRMATYRVKFLTEKLTKIEELTSGQVNELIVRLIVFWHKYVHFDIRTQET